MTDLGLRRQFAGEFRSLDRQSIVNCCLIVLAYVVQIAAAGALGAMLIHSGQPVALTGAGLAVLLFFMGTRLRGLNNIVHECSHFSFCTDRGANIVFGKLCSALILKSFQKYRVEHLSHHTNLGDYDHDLDFHAIQDLRIEEPLTPRTIARHLGTALAGLHIPYYVRFDFSADDGWPWAALKLLLAAGAVALAAVDPLAALLLVIVPFVWVFSAINYWTDCIDHGGLFGSGSELDGSRNVPLPRVLRFLLFPRNDCFHLIHHLFPQVPVQHFDACHEKLMQHPAYRARAERPVLGAVADTAPAMADLPAVPERS